MSTLNKRPLGRSAPDWQEIVPPARLDGLRDRFRRELAPAAVAKHMQGRWHEETLIESLQNYLASKPYELVQSSNSECTRYSLRVHFTRPPPITRWGLILGDCLHNYRSSLDYLMWEIVVRLSPQGVPPAPKRVYFPIYDKPSEFRAWEKALKTDLPDLTRYWIERWQPYKQPGPLRWLRELNNVDKHTTIHLLVMGEESGLIGGSAPDGARPIRTSLGGQGPVEEGAEVYWMDFGQPTPGVELNCDFRFEPAIEVAADPHPHNLSQLLLGIQQSAFFARHEIETAYRGLRGYPKGDGPAPTSEPE